MTSPPAIIIRTMADFDALPEDMQRKVKRQAKVQKARESVAGWAPIGPPTKHGRCILKPWQVNLTRRMEEVFRYVAENKAAQAKVKRVRIILVSAPPQVGKSESVSRRAPTWAMGALGLSVAVCSYAADLANGHSRAARRMMRSPEAIEVWPHLAEQSEQGDAKDTEKEWTVAPPTPKQASPEFISRGRKGLTGRDPDIIILDDMYEDANDYESSASRRQVDSFLRTAVMARLFERGGTVFDMGTRWGVHDTKGWWYARIAELEAAGLEVQVEEWRYPLKREAGKMDAMEDEREVGEYLTDTWDAAKEAGARVLYGRHHRAVLDCDPVEEDGGLYKLEHFEATYSEHPDIIARSCEATFLSADCAETQDGGDWTVLQRWGVKEGRAYWLGQRRGQWHEANVVLQVKDGRETWRTTGVLVEDTSSGKVVNTILEGKVPGLERVKVSGQGSKRARIRGTLALWRLGSVVVPSLDNAHTPWWHERDDAGLTIRDRMLALRGETEQMTGEVDDEADAATNFLRWWVGGGRKKPARMSRRRNF